jgi:transposase
MSKYTFQEFKAEYPDDGACLDAIIDSRHGGRQFVCPGCGVEAKFHRMSKRRAYACQECGHHIYPCVGTIFEKSRTSLTHWFFAMYLMTSTRHGVAAKELERQIGVTYKTAWRMAHELRKLMAQADDRRPLAGHVEVDETIVGGRQTRKNKKERGTNKTVVFGMVERQGLVRAGSVSDATRKTLEPIILGHVQRGSRISSDESGAYTDLKWAPYRHETVNHYREEWVRGDVHTNTIEGFWSHLKRSISGTHIHVSRKHLWKYVAEFSYRRNARKSHSAMFSRLILALCLPRVQDA